MFVYVPVEPMKPVNGGETEYAVIKEDVERSKSLGKTVFMKIQVKTTDVYTGNSYTKKDGTLVTSPQYAKIKK